LHYFAAENGMNPDQRQGEYFLFLEGKQLGPYPFFVLVEAVRRKIIKKTDLVWRPEWDEWRPAAYVDRLYPPSTSDGLAIEAQRSPAIDQSQAASPNEKTAVSSQENIAVGPQVAQGKRNYFVRHWRGDLSLPVSYWLNGLLANLFIVALILLFGQLIERAGNSGLTAFLLIIFLVVVAVLITWQCGGTWRSASRRGGFWAGAAKVMIVIGVLRTVYEIGKIYPPIVTEHLRIAFGDEKFGGHSFRLLRDGTELEFTGGINVGTAKEFEGMLQAAGQLRVIHLNSYGGRIAEANLIAAAVQKRGLITYVSQRCLSACTHIFLAGRERWVGEDGKLGFHQPAFAGLSREYVQPMLDEEQRFLLGKGISSDFVEKALATPNDKMWEPSHGELGTAKVITGVANSRQFATSGSLGKLASSDQFEKTLLNIPLYATLKRVEPQTYERVISLFRIGFEQGRPQAEIFDETQKLFGALVMARLPYAEDRQLLTFIDLKLEYMRALRSLDPEACVASEDDTKGAKLNLNLATRLPELAQKDLEFKRTLLETARKERPLPKEEAVTPILQRVWERLDRRFGTKVDLLNADQLDRSQYTDYCDVSMAFYEELRKLPTKDAADVARHIYSQLSKN
jgi:GYF domain 2